MSKILMRAGCSPYEELSYERLSHVMGANLGNLVYANSIYRALTVDDSTDVVPTRYKFSYTDKEMAAINSGYDALVLPFADAIRHNFIHEFKSLTKLVRKLTIPCVVIGVGIRAPYEPGKSSDPQLDRAARQFFRAVLDKSAKIGVRGQITADYLKALGFREEADFTVTGCPSMYTWGDALDVRDSWKKVADGSPDARISFNMSQGSTPAHIRFIRENAAFFYDAVYLPQREEELRLMYAGVPFSLPAAEGFPMTLEDELYQNGNVRMYGDAASWLSFLKTRDLSFGTRMHGNITAVLAGTPALFCPFDARTRELADYHGFAFLAPEEIENRPDLRDVAAKKDFRGILKCHRRNFEHYVDFLNENGLSHIYGTESCVRETSHDRKVAAVRHLPPLLPITQVSGAEAARRLTRYHEGAFDRKTTLMHELKSTVKQVIGRK